MNASAALKVCSILGLSLLGMSPTAIVLLGSGEKWVQVSAGVLSVLVTSAVAWNADVLSLSVRELMVPKLRVLIGCAAHDSWAASKLVDFLSENGVLCRVISEDNHADEGNAASPWRLAEDRADFIILIGAEKCSTADAKQSSPIAVNKPWGRITWSDTPKRSAEAVFHEQETEKGTISQRTTAAVLTALETSEPGRAVASALQRSVWTRATRSLMVVLAMPLPVLLYAGALLAQFFVLSVVEANLETDAAENRQRVGYSVVPEVRDSTIESGASYQPPDDARYTEKKVKCKGGSGRECNNVGYGYWKGGEDSGVEDRRAAIYWLDLGCELGNRQACNNSGHLYEHGYGPPESKGLAVQRYRSACDESFAKACFNLSRAYAAGLETGGERLDLAFSAAKRACALDYPGGCFLLGSAYWFGKGTARSLQQAGISFEKGCRLGSRKSCRAKKKLLGTD